MSLKRVCSPILAGVVLAAAGTGCLSLNPKSGRADAERIALDRVPGGQIQVARLERVRGRRVWSVDILTSGSRPLTEVLVDARTGEVVPTDIQTPTGLLSEARADPAGSRR